MLLIYSKVVSFPRDELNLHPHLPHEFSSISRQASSMTCRFRRAASRFRRVRSSRSARRHMLSSFLAVLQPPRAACRKPRAWHCSSAVMMSSQPVVVSGGRMRCEIRLDWIGELKGWVGVGMEGAGVQEWGLWLRLKEWRKRIKGVWRCAYEVKGAVPTAVIFCVEMWVHGLLRYLLSRDGRASISSLGSWWGAIVNLLFRFCLLGNGSWMKFDDLSAIVRRATFVAAGMYSLFAPSLVRRYG